jgi:hypothetical protein
MNSSTITIASFTLRGPGSLPVAGTVVYDESSDMARFKTTSALADGTVYTATITTGATDVAGNALAGNYVWNFTTSVSGGLRDIARGDKFVLSGS